MACGVYAGTQFWLIPTSMHFSYIQCTWQMHVPKAARSSELSARWEDWFFTDNHVVASFPGLLYMPPVFASKTGGVEMKLSRGPFTTSRPLVATRPFNQEDAFTWGWSLSSDEYSDEQRWAVMSSTQYAIVAQSMTHIPILYFNGIHLAEQESAVLFC